MLRAARKLVDACEECWKKYKRLPKANQDVGDLTKVGKMCSNYRRHYRDGNLTKEVVDMFKSLPGWTWENVQKDQWHKDAKKHVAQLKKEFKSGGGMAKTSEEWLWYQRHKRGLKANGLDDKQKPIIKELVEMEEIMEQWLKGAREAKDAAAEREGKKRCEKCDAIKDPAEFVRRKGKGLSKWCNGCRDDREAKDKARYQGKDPGLCSRKNCQNRKREGGKRCELHYEQERTYIKTRESEIQAMKVTAALSLCHLITECIGNACVACNECIGIVSATFLCG